MLSALAGGAACDFNDPHFHLTNYIQEGLTLPELLRVWATGRVAQPCLAFPIIQRNVSAHNPVRSDNSVHYSARAQPTDTAYWRSGVVGVRDQWRDLDLAALGR